MKVSKKRSMSWANKWVVFKFCKLYIYEKPEGYFEPDATIELTNDTGINRDKSDPFSFVIKNFWFKPANEQDLNTWMFALSPWVIPPAVSTPNQLQKRKSTQLPTSPLSSPPPSSNRNTIHFPNYSANNNSNPNNATNMEAPLFEKDGATLLPSMDPSVDSQPQPLKSEQNAISDKQTTSHTKSGHFTEDNHQFQLSLLKKVAIPVISLFFLPFFLPKSFLLG